LHEVSHVYQTKFLLVEYVHLKFMIINQIT
jgi:hypothetical protein